MTKICFLNPFGTEVYDALIEETVTPSLRPGTELVIRHLVDYPANMDYFVPKHLAGGRRAAGGGRRRARRLRRVRDRVLLRPRPDAGA